MTRILDDFGIVLILVALLAIAVVVRRTLLRRRGASLDLCMRPRGGVGHWTLGLARYAGDSLQWYRTFGFSLRASRTFRRDELAVIGRRTPTRGDAAYFLHGAQIIECL